MPTRKSVLITGASSGLGEGMAREFARLGKDLGLCARRLENLTALKKELLEINPSIKVSIKTLDVNQHDDVFQVFKAFQQEFGRIDRVIVNAGIGKGAPIGTGGFKANLQTAETNFVAALAQCEAALEIFRAQNNGHLVVISSMSAMRGMPRATTTYAATKAGIAVLAEGIRAELLNTPIKVTTLFPGYIKTAINEKLKNAQFMVDRETGCKAMVKLIEKEVDEACVPEWPWTAIGYAMRHLPLKMIAKMY
ncbi:MAG TPA: SDR family oxidoreductase [Pseudomonadales bacterium]|nr:SDR family oxidoreductase [Pseudomonadales bacterium]